MTTKVFDPDHTHEASLWIMNTESLYFAGKKCSSPGRLKHMFQLYMPKRTVNVAKVNWQEIFDDLRSE